MEFLGSIPKCSGEGTHGFGLDRVLIFGWECGGTGA